MKPRITIFLILVILALAQIVPAVSAQTNIACAQDYIVVEGDWLVNLAEKFYGDRGSYNAIFVATNLQAQTDSSYAVLTTPTLLEVGQKLCIPGKADVALLNTNFTTTPSAASPTAATTDATVTATSTLTATVATTTVEPTAATPTITSTVETTATATITATAATTTTATAASAPARSSMTPTASAPPASLILSPADITFVPYSLATDIRGHVVPASAFDNSEPPGPVGAPAHIAFQFDGADRLWVIPAQAYASQWDAAGNDTISRSISQLRLLLRDKPTTVHLPAPFLPPVPATNDIAARIRYLDFNGGSGIAFIGRWAQDPSPVLSTQTYYSFLGLTNDGKYIVSFQYPVQTSALPDDVGELTPEHLAEIEANPAAYFVQTTELLNKLANSAFGPDLSRLDSLVFSIRVPSLGSTLPTPVGSLPTASAPSPDGSATPAATSANASTDKQRLLATDWKWLGTTSPTSTLAVDDPEKYTLRFNNANGFGVTADCNIGAGNFRVNGNVLQIIDLQATLAYCDDNTLDTQFTAQLLQADTFSFEGSNLLIQLKNGVGIMRFRK